MEGQRTPAPRPQPSQQFSRRSTVAPRVLRQKPLVRRALGRADQRSLSTRKKVFAGLWGPPCSSLIRFRTQARSNRPVRRNLLSETPGQRLTRPPQNERVGFEPRGPPHALRPARRLRETLGRHACRCLRVYKPCGGTDPTNSCARTACLERQRQCSRPRSTILKGFPTSTSMPFPGCRATRWPRSLRSKALLDADLGTPTFSCGGSPHSPDEQRYAELRECLDQGAQRRSLAIRKPFPPTSRVCATSLLLASHSLGAPQKTRLKSDGRYTELVIKICLTLRAAALAALETWGQRRSRRHDDRSARLELEELASAPLTWPRPRATRRPRCASPSKRAPAGRKRTRQATRLLRGETTAATLVTNTRRLLASTTWR